MSFLVYSEIRQRLTPLGLYDQENLFVKTLDPTLSLKHALSENEVNFCFEKGGMNFRVQMGDLGFGINSIGHTKPF